MSTQYLFIDQKLPQPFRQVRPVWGAGSLRLLINYLLVTLIQSHRCRFLHNPCVEFDVGPVRNLDETLNLSALS